MNKLFDKIRARLAQDCEYSSPFEPGAVELDESDFGARRVRGRGAAGKAPVFGLLKRGGKVDTQVVKRCSMAEILPLIEETTSAGVVRYTDGFKTCNGRADFGYQKHDRIKQGHNEFAPGPNHLNGIENFWGLCKVRLSRFRGSHKHQFYLHLKEYEFRFNLRHENSYKQSLDVFPNKPLKLS